MKSRIISGIVIAVLAVALGLVGGVPLGVVLMVCAMVGYYELTRALGVFDVQKEKCNGLTLAGLGMSALYYLFLIASSQTTIEFAKEGNFLTRVPLDAMPFIEQANSLIVYAVIVLLMIDMAIYVMTFPKYDAGQVVSAFFSFIYAPVMMSCIYRARFLPYGLFIFAIIMFCSWISDTCAFAVGKAIGRHKMTPLLSPNKTIEGAIGGIVGATLLCILAAWIVNRLFPGEDVYFSFAVIGIAGSLLGIVGDLAASGIKRNQGIKDYGNIIPGHGGIMDRFDSVIFTAPPIYMLAAIFLTILRA